MTVMLNEAAILRAIAAGRTMDELLSFGPWTVIEVASTLRKYKLIADENGNISKTNGTHDYTLIAALRSPQQHVRTKALRAQALLRDLAKELYVADAERDLEVKRDKARQALHAWDEWLKEQRAEVRQQLRRLNPNARINKGAA